MQTENHRAIAWQRSSTPGRWHSCRWREIRTAPLLDRLVGGDQRSRTLDGLVGAQFNDALTRAFESKLGAVRCSDKRFRVPLRQRHATEYFRDGIVLVGDAAHSIHPLAGQGVNLGVLDVIALSEELHAGLNAGRQVSDSRILERYQRRRKPHNLRMMWVMEGFKHLFAGRPPSSLRPLKPVK